MPFATAKRAKRPIATRAGPRLDIQPLGAAFELAAADGLSPAGRGGQGLRDKQSRDDEDRERLLKLGAMAAGDCHDSEADRLRVGKRPTRNFVHPSPAVWAAARRSPFGARQKAGASTGDKRANRLSTNTLLEASHLNSPPQHREGPRGHVGLWTKTTAGRGRQ